MTHTYTIKGMTCNGCRTSVEEKLNAVPQVKEATVNLEKEEAIITMDTHISTEALQGALPDKYTITEKIEKNVFKQTPAAESSVLDQGASQSSKFEQLKPLFLILGYISIAALLLHYKTWDIQAMMLDFMGLFLIVFSFFKLLDLKGFPESFKMYDPLAKVLPVYAWIYPFLEAALGLMFLMRFEVEIALVVTLIILSITTVGVTRTLLDKKAIQCACLGTALKLPMTEATFIENAIMIIMGVIMLTKLLV